MADKKTDERVLKRAFEETLKTEFKASGKPETYGDFLQLKTLLNMQHTFMDPPHQDELLFVIIHQVSELWLKLMHSQIVQLRKHLRQDRFGPAFKDVDRIKAIQEQLISAWKTLLTMTPADYLQFRDALGDSSGFQSYGYRQIEYILGNKDASHLRVHAHDADVTAMLNATLDEPSVYDEVIRLLARQGFDVPADLLDRNFREPYAGDARIVAIWEQVFLDTERYWDLYCLAEKLMDVETLFQRWRFDHMKAVERVIGMRPGTGGSSGVAFLKKALDLKFFHDLYDVREVLIYKTPGDA